ncbi:MAG: TonB-dependent receptor [Bacteroidia bacterium]
MTALLLAVCGGISAQTVTGRVTSSRDGEPLVGATVLVKGTTSGAFTGEDGEYALRAASDAVLVFSFVGHERQEIAVGGQTQINVELVATEATLEEVVVTGYGTQKAREVTSAITSVRAEDFNAGNVNDPAQLIQGKVAGLSISRPGGDPNGGFAIRLRGLSSLGQNTSPLIVIDGVIGASLQTVDPNDIASIDVLKDGSAAAIYGTRASAGVILITTKKGLAGKSTFNYNGYVTAEQIARSVPVADKAEFIALGGADYGGNTNWIEEVTRTGISHTHNLSMSGGAGNTSYRAAINFRDIDGVGIASGFQQLNGRLNLTQTAFNDKLKITFDVVGTERDATYGFAEGFRYAATYAPSAPVFSDLPSNERFGGYFQLENFDYFNPVAIVEQNQNIGEDKRLLFSLRGDYEIIEGLKASLFYSSQRENDLRAQFYSRESYWRGGAAGERKGNAARSTDDRNTKLFEATLNYNKQFDNFGLDVLGGYSYQDNFFQGFGASGSGLPSDAYTFNNLGTATDFANGQGNVYSYANDYQVIGFFGRARIDINNTYYLMASVRQEGSTRFGEGNKWGTFPAVSAGVQLSNLISVSWIDELKLRAGYGITGALPGNSYLSLQRFGVANQFLFNGGFTPAIGPVNNANPLLAWETKGELDLGVDFQFFNYKLSGSIDYYNRATRDLLFNADVSVPPFVFSTALVNLNNVVLRNSGVEASIGYKFGNGGNFSYEPRALFSTYRTVLDTLAGVQADFPFGSGGVYYDFVTSPGAPGLNNNPTVRVAIGEPIGQLWGPQVNVAASEEGKSFVYEDVDGDGTVEISSHTADDNAVLGNGLPDFSIGFNNSFVIGKLDINFFFRGDFGHSLANMYRVFYEPLGARDIENKVVTDKFINMNNAPIFNSYYVEDASYIALDNASIGYSLKIKGYDLRLYANGQNLFYITGYTGVDPNVRFADPGDADNGGAPARQFNPSPLAPGLDRRNTYFRTRSFTLGVNFNF